MKKLLPILASIALALPAFAASQGIAVRAVDGYSVNQKLTNGYYSGGVHVGSNYVGGVYYFGGGFVPRFTNGYVVMDSVEMTQGDFIMIDPGGEFIGTHRGNGQFLTNIPSAAVSGLPPTIQLPNFQRHIAGLSNMVFWNMGDDAITPVVRMRQTLSESFPLGGGIAPLGWGFSAGTINQPSPVFTGLRDPWPEYTGMATGSSVTNDWATFAPVTAGVVLMAWQDDNFGTLTVRTQAYSGGAFSGNAGTVTTVDMDNGGAFTAYATNIAINSAVPVAVSLYSSGSNLVWHAYQYSSGNPGYAMLSLAGSNFDINHMMTNSAKSNTFRTFISAVPPTLLTQFDKNSSNSLYVGSVSVHNLLTNAGLASDYAIFTEIPATNDIAAGRNERLAVLNVAKATGRTAVDTFIIFAGLDHVGLAPSYLSDGVHLTTPANYGASGTALGWMGFNRDNFARIQGGSYQRITSSNLVTQAIGHPSSSGAIWFSNHLNMGYTGSRMQIVDKSGLTGAASAGSQFLNLYSGNNNHGIGVGTMGGVVGGYWFSDGSILFGTPSALRVRFNVSASEYTFTGAVTATSFTGDGSALTALNDDNVGFDDADNLWTATAIGPALEELNDSINSGTPNGTGAKLHWSQLLGVPAGFADGTDDGAGGSGDTNGISYVDGSLLIDAVRTRRDAGDNHVLDLVWTNNVSALVFTNQETASSIYFRYMNGHIPLFMTEGAGIFINSELDLQLSADSVLALQANTDVRTLNNTNGTTVIDFSGDTVVIAGGVNLDEINATTLNVNRFNISTNLYGNTTSVNFANSRSTTNLAGNLVFDAGLLNFSATNYNELILHCYGDGANRTVTAPTGWTTTRSDHVVTNGQWSWILVSAQIGVFTNMAQVDFQNEP